jgi:DNA-binding LacI/PurR family transcriptional regulator
MLSGTAYWAKQVILDVTSLQTGSVSAVNPKLAILNVNFHGVAVANTAVQYLASQGHHKIGLNNAVERSCAVRRLVACRKLQTKTLRAFKKKQWSTEELGKWTKRQ